MNKTKSVNSKENKNAQQIRYFSVVTETGEKIGRYRGKNEKIITAKAFKKLDETLNEENKLNTQVITIRECTKDKTHIRSYLATRTKLVEPETIEFIDPITNQKSCSVHEYRTTIKIQKQY
jgi:hypothetical protein